MSNDTTIRENSTGHVMSNDTTIRENSNGHVQEILNKIIIHKTVQKPNDTSNVAEKHSCVASDISLSLL